MTDHRWAAAVAGASAQGADLTYDARFERLLAEIDKLSSVTGGRPDWRLIDADAEELLTTATKDLRLAAWLTVAKTQLKGWSGLVDALDGVDALLTAHWEGMYPTLSRLRARANVVEWLWTQLPSVVRTLPTTVDDAATCDASEAMLAKVLAQLEAKLGDANPGARDIRTALTERKREMPQPAPPAPEPAPAPQVAAPAAPQPAAVALPVAIVAPPAPAAPEAATVEAALDVARGWTDALFGLARQARRASPSHAWAYRLARIAAWLTVEDLPEVEADNRTYVRAPRPADQKRLEELLQRGEWADLVDASEEGLVESPLWLDLNRFSALGLERLGHAEARGAVVRESAALVRRFPRLTALAFTNGSPLASAETSAWIAQEGAAAGGATAPAQSTTDLAFLDDARSKIASGDVSGALSAALRTARDRASLRDRFCAEVKVAELALRSNETGIAKAIAEDLLERIDPGMEAWAPVEVGVCYEVFINAERASAKAEDRILDQRVESVLKRLLRVDPESALRLWHHAR